MFPPPFAYRHHPNPRRRIWRIMGVAVLAGLALAVAACGAPSSGGGGNVPAPTPTATATQTPKPTATATPAPKSTATATPVPSTSWHIVSSPNETQYQESELYSLSVLSPTAAWAVGGSLTDGLAEHGLIEQWDGATWRVVTNANSFPYSSVAALSPSDVWAVGYNRTPRQEGSIIQFVHWDGTRWSIVPNPNPTQPSTFVLSMAAVATNNVWAVGQMNDTSNVILPLTERWDGTAWKIVPTPTLPDVTESLFHAVARIPGTNQLWAVGYALKGPRPAYGQPLIERWNGTAWQVVPGPALPSGAFGGNLNGVVALSASNAWAVGDYTASDHTIRTLIAHWDGATWKVATSPGVWGTLASVAAAGTQDVRAVGHSFAGDGNVQHGLIEQWNGASWRTVTSPEPKGAAYSALNSVAMDGMGTYWAAGSYRYATSAGRTLIVSYP